ncbi:MAG: 3-phosphoserine/phosphohydroxythreonine transaminase [Gammaproteobacteria bacterium]|nr:3-phosphoserine/phosphohydroxythreonine transaminase [Gammaproteobacteria bacterium]
MRTARTCTADAGGRAPFSFTAAAAPLPAEVVAEAQRGLIDWGGSGRSVLDLPFGSEEYRALAADAEACLRRLLALPSEYHVLFLQGGAYTHFAAVPLNLLGAGTGADYVQTGLWSTRALAEASRYGAVRVAASAAASGFDRVPDARGWHLDPHASYCHITTNETAHGVQLRHLPETGAVPLVADVTSDFLTRPLDAGRLGLFYASAQKTAGTAGLTVVVVREDLLHHALPQTPAALNYTRHVRQGPVNTPPVYAVYVAGLTFAWLERQGGPAAMARANARKSALLYAVIDAEPLYRCRVRPPDRSVVSICFDFSQPALQRRFLEVARTRGLVGLEGHPTRGGIRVSLHNTAPLERVEALAQLMREFARRHPCRAPFS